MPNQTDVIPDHYQLYAAGDTQTALPTAHGKRRQHTRSATQWTQALHTIPRVLLWLEPFWIVALSPSLLLRDYLWDPWVQPWLIAALLLFWPLRLLSTRRLMPATAVSWPLLLLLFWAPMGVLASPNHERSWEALGYLALGLASYLALVNWSLTRRYPWLVAGLVAAVGLALAALGPSLLINISDEFFVFSDDLTKSQPIPIFGLSETVNPNVLAGILAILAPLFFALTLRWDWLRNRWLRYGLAILCALATLAMLATVLLAQSRGAYLAVAIGLMVVLVLRWPRSILVLAIALVAAGTVLSWEGIFRVVQAVGTNDSLTSLSGRGEVWQRALYALRDFPLTGIGMGVFDLVIPKLYPYFEIKNGAEIPHAHNLWLQVGMDLGLPGLILYGWLWVSIVRTLLQLIRQNSQAVNYPDTHALTRQERYLLHHHLRQLERAAALRWTLAVGLLGAFVAMFVHGLVDAVTWGTKLAFVPWLLISLVTLLSLQNETAE
jgi:putative inorganic carbon (HCO3(-)) transporter